MTWSMSIQGWLDWLRAGGAPATTVGLRQYQINRFRDAFPHRAPDELTADDLAGWLASRGWAVETLRSMRSALRSFYGWAQAVGHCKVNPAKLLRSIPASPAKPRPAPEGKVDAALATALAAGDQRVWLMLMLGSRHGLRRGEIARIHTTDVIDGLGGRDLIVHGKGGKDRIVPLLDGVAAVIDALPEGWVFAGETAAGYLTPAHVSVLVRRALGGTTSAHQLRHRFAARTYEATGGDIRVVQELLGHASVATTQRYVPVAGAALRRAVVTSAA